jgi:O-antigen ligase
MVMKIIIKLDNLIYSIFFLLPVYLIRFNFLGVPTNLLEVLISLVLVLWLLKYGRGFWDSLSKITGWKYFWPVSLILLGLILSTLANNNILKGLGIIKGWFVFPLVLIFLTSQIIPPNKRENVFRAFYLSAVGVALISLFYWLFGALTYDNRLQAFYNSPNFLAMYLAPALIIGLILFSRQLKFYGMTLGIISLALYLTFSYAAWMAVVIALAVIFIVNKHSSRKLIIIVSLIFLVLVSFQMQKNKSLNLLQANPRSSWSSRIMIWRAAGKILSDNWILGIGPGNFQDKYLKYQKHFPPYLEWAVPQPHNLFLAFWLGSGLLGIMGFLWLLSIWFRQFFQKKNSQLAWIGLGIILYILLHGLVDTTYFKNDLAIIFWLSLWAI